MKNLIYLVTIFSILTSCIMVRKNNIETISDKEIETLLTSSKQKTKIFLKWKIDESSFLYKPKENVIEKISSNHRTIFLESINKSNCCELANSEKEANIIIDGKFYNKTDNAGLFLAILTGYSLYIIPSWTTIKSEVQASVAKGKIVKNYTVNDSAVFAQWLPFILAMPFRSNPVKEENVMNKNIYKKLLVEMQKDKMLSVN